MDYVSEFVYVYSSMVEFDLQPLPYKRQGYNFDTSGLTQVLIFFCVFF